MAELVELDLGKKEYQLGKNGPIVEILTSDGNLPIRLSDGIKNIEKHIKDMQTEYGVNDIKDIDEISKVSTGNIETDIEFMRKADNYVKEQLNMIFNYDVSSIILGPVSSFTFDSKTGEYLFEKIINIFVPIINKEFGACVDKMKSRIKTYTDRKGMHPALR